MGCTSLVEIIFPASLEYIGNEAFADCSKLQSARFMGDAPQISEGVFSTTAEEFTIFYPKDAAGWKDAEYIYPMKEY